MTNSRYPTLSRDEDYREGARNVAVPERALLAAVLLQALRDAQGRDCLENVLQQEARAWLASPENLAPFCRLLDLDAVTLAQGIQQQLRNPFPPGPRGRVRQTRHVP